MTSDNLPEQIIDSIYSTELNEIAVDFAEFGMDQLLDEGALKEIPLIGPIVRLFKGALDIRDKIFIAKIARFLFSLSNTGHIHRASFNQKINEDKKLKKKVGESLVVILDRIDDFEKPDLIAKCFGNYLVGKISYSEFRRLAVAIDMAFINDLRALLGQIIEEDRYAEDHLTNLSRTGLVDFEKRGTLEELETTKFKISSLGQLFIDIMNDSLKGVETKINDV